MRPDLDRVKPGPCPRCGEPTDSRHRVLGKRWRRGQVEHRVHVATLMVLCADQLAHRQPKNSTNQPVQEALAL